MEQHLNTFPDYPQLSVGVVLMDHGDYHEALKIMDVYRDYTKEGIKLTILVASNKTKQDQTK